MKLTRAYKLKIYPTKSKKEIARYYLNRAKPLFSRYLAQMLFNNCQYTSTLGLGTLANKMQRLALGTAKSILATSKKTGNKWNVPRDPKVQIPVDITVSKTSKIFEFWVGIPNLWTKGKCVYVPCRSHKKVKQSLKNNWKLSNSAYLDYNSKTEEFYVYIFLSKTVVQEKPNLKEVVGIDVGIKHSVVTSEGHLGHGLSKVIHLQKKRYAERQKQKYFKNKIKTKTYLKQLLDIEAKNLIRRAKHSKQSLFVEDPKVLALLKMSKIQGWANTYLANRLQVLGYENEIYVGFINPYQTSITCSKCGHVDKLSRVNRDTFSCTHCGNMVQADLNAARNIALKGLASVSNQGLNPGTSGYLLGGGNEPFRSF